MQQLRSRGARSVPAARRQAGLLLRLLRAEAATAEQPLLGGVLPALLTLAQGSLCGIAAGLVVGAAARVAMRIVALGIPDGIRQLPTFTAEGTVAILITGAIVGAPFGAVYAVSTDAVPGPRVLRGLLFGLFMLATVGPLFFIGTPDEFVSPGRVILFTLLFPIFGVALGAAWMLVRRLAGALPEAAQWTAVVVAAGGGTLVGIGLTSLAAQSIQIHGANAVALFAPWLVLIAAVLRSDLVQRLASEQRQL